MTQSVSLVNPFHQNLKTSKFSQGEYAYIEDSILRPFRNARKNKETAGKNGEFDLSFIRLG